MKTQSKGPSQPSSPKPEALDEKITHLTEEVAKKANLYKVPALIALVLIVAVVAIFSLTSSLGEQAEMELSESVYLLFEPDNTGELKKSPSELRSEAQALAKTLEGEKIEPVFASLYAAWLFKQNEGNDREQALALLSSALSRHEGNLILTLANDELTQNKSSSEGFTLPAIPEPDPPPSVDDGSTDLPGSGIPVVLPVGEGESSTENTPTDATPTDGSSTTGESDSGGAAPVSPPSSQPAGGR